MGLALHEGNPPPPDLFGMAATLPFGADRKNRSGGVGLRLIWDVVERRGVCGARRSLEASRDAGLRKGGVLSAELLAPSCVRQLGG